ncbi:MAG TPA: LLM class flavin-dependent oxidoreductase [Spongiibacteraceae bacterium]|nr:LLM class flavin-dependent oxidoreductase [Spongiibacteraceae bacterium]HCS28775.1 LLM class flavin-dependent oxidoreductase [Spongiibacteraceae bacterium]|tara:strand:- start:162 stop:1139 length:978 start_codon:yes stop_codon:yes gene_type:complete
MPQLLLRFDMRNPDFGADQRALYDAALDMAQWADENGFDTIQISEHHGSDDGYLPSPIVLAAAMAARTRRVRLRMSLIILPFHDPLRVAEDLAVLDIISNGRLDVVVGAGYVPEEFEMFGVALKDRGTLMENKIAALKKAWTGKEFDYEGRRARVTPTPVQQPHPPLWMGGSSKPAARRAARLVDYFYTENRELFGEFNAERERLGKESIPFMELGSGFFVVADDPDTEWQRMAPYILFECNSYGKWQASSAMQGQYLEMTDAEPLRATGLYPIIRPDEAADYLRQLGDNAQLCLHPLIAGQSPDDGWKQLHRFADTVLPLLSRK